MKETTLSGVRVRLLSVARQLRANMQARGAVPRDVAWEQVKWATRRIYIREAKTILRALGGVNG
jgi:hypothetical protein